MKAVFEILHALRSDVFRAKLDTPREISGEKNGFLGREAELSTCRKGETIVHSPVAGRRKRDASRRCCKRKRKIQHPQFPSLGGVTIWQLSDSLFVYHFNFHTSVT
jgi:hypothetical protein